MHKKRKYLREGDQMSTGKKSLVDITLFLVIYVLKIETMCRFFMVSRKKYMFTSVI